MYWIEFMFKNILCIQMEDETNHVIKKNMDIVVIQPTKEKIIRD